MLKMIPQEAQEWAETEGISGLVRTYKNDNSRIDTTHCLYGSLKKD